jgi:starch synthase
MNNPQKLADYGLAGRQRAIADFGWDAIAAQTENLYRLVIDSRAK